MTLLLVRELGVDANGLNGGRILVIEGLIVGVCIDYVAEHRFGFGFGMGSGVGCGIDTSTAAMNSVD